ncbi:fungal specific transcription factor domain-containing protein [Aspergillus neoniger CBS 115656]|uniref:Xylanolytic transcriptional activator regulatory domain-containing protein n=1 Tax=Aspergillus neoniger (strain CBS 115656) TaxID=1448310 RepID=A0A318YK49_ASPNB|nr:hypothetical protein BO87DRAFT_44853 [Aspergillus neoniger CBS 115656]PYH34875.1 hypothetical protein BO87DRAFT_44853 [Aspergillus neoniger CBS 115656]
MEGRLHRSLFRALLALATLFLQPRNHSNDILPAIEGQAELTILSSYHSCGRPWAKAALRELLISALECPSLMIVQALECLQLYWFGIGDFHSGSLCLALAYRSCHLLGYSRKSTDNSDYNDESLESELSRRCFWACWTSTCIVMEPEPCIKLAWQEVGLVPLPGLISNTSSGYTITLNQTMDENWISRSLDRRISSDSYPGSAAISMKMVGVWAKIQQLCKEHTSAPNAQSFGQLEKLSHLATSLFDESTTRRNSGHQNDPKTEGESLLLVHDALYHQCQIAAHWMIVPLLSGIPSDPTIRSDKQRESADTVLKHAELLERLLAPYLYGRSDISRLPPLVGFGAFVAGIVLLATEISRQDCGVNGSFTKDCRNGPRIPAVRAIVHLLDHLRVYWRALERPVSCTSF